MPNSRRKDQAPEGGGRGRARGKGKDNVQDQEGGGRGRARGRGKERGQQEQEPGAITSKQSIVAEQVQQEQELVASISKLSIVTDWSTSSSRSLLPCTFTKRPGRGRNGQPIMLYINHFPVNIKSEEIFQYDVEIEHDKSHIELKNPAQKLYPAKPIPAFLKREVMEIFFKQESTLFAKTCPTYDGNKNVFTCSEIPKVKGSLERTVERNESNRKYANKYKITLKPVNKTGQTLPAINLSRLEDLYQGRTRDICYESLMSLDVALRYGSSLKLPSNGRSFYCRPEPGNNRCKLSDGKMVWTGFYQSLRPDEERSVLVVNRSSALYYPECSVLDFVGMTFNKNIAGLKKLAPHEVTQLSKEMKDVRFIATHLDHLPTFKCDKVTRENSTEITFTKEENGESVTTSVSEYFYQTYKPLRYPLLPCLDSARRYFPLEVCKLQDGQIYKRTPTDKQRSEIIKITITSPEKCLSDIKTSVKIIKQNSSVILKAYRIDLSNEPLSVEARVIDPPRVLYKGNKEMRPRDGSWTLRDLLFFEPGQVANWVVWCADRNAFESGDAQGFTSRLCNMAKRMGVWMNKPFKVIGRAVENVQSDLDFFLRKTRESFKVRLDFLLIILPEKDDHTYAGIKYYAETRLGIMTQCILSKNVRDGGQSLLICNVLQKINSKLGGRNCSLFSTQEPSTMFVGADVNHAGVRDREKKSFAAVVASIDSQANRYVTRVLEQTNRSERKNHMEMIEDLKNTIVTFLQEFKNNEKKYPERIIFYRDGVSEGEFHEVQQKEISDVRKACQQLNIRAKVTFVVVAKRHHTRLFPADPNKGVGKFKNVPPGTVVDRVVVHPVFYDFYLCSHFGIQGTSRPTHYTVLEDDTNFSADDLQKLTYFLCHMSARCTRAESIPTPVKYAHLSALRHRHYSLHATHNTSGHNDEEEPDDQAAVHDFLENVTPIENIRKKMFFV